MFACLASSHWRVGNWRIMMGMHIRVVYKQCCAVNYGAGHIQQLLVFNALWRLYQNINPIRAICSTGWVQVLNKEDGEIITLSLGKPFTHLKQKPHGPSKDLFRINKNQCYLRYSFTNKKVENMTCHFKLFLARLFLS